MGHVRVFNFLTLNGYFKGPNQDISWHRHGGAEENEYSGEGAGSGSTLLFGRRTYKMMASYWPTPAALKSDPVVAQGMNSAEKVVFSKTLKKADWNNTRIVKGNLEKEIKRMKQAGKDMTVLGSGTIVTQLAQAGLIDEYVIMLDPVAIPSGTTLLKGMKHTVDLKLTNSRTFKSGVVLLTYQPVGNS